MPSRTRARLTAALLIATVSLSLAACVGIPTSGSVTVGQTLAEQNTGDFEFFPLGPAPDATQEGILRGFVAAFTGSAGDYAVARQFLSTGFAAEWNPRSNVTIRTNAEEFVTVGASSMDYAISAASTVDSVGAFRQNNEAVPLTLRFEFVQERGQWRISKAQNGIVLSDATFRPIFAQHPLYFLDPTNSHLVPDLRWFPRGTATLRIVSALLAGPPGWLQGAVRTAFPDGTRLTSPTVEVQSGVAIVDLSPEAVGASASDRQLMQLQLTASLTNVPNIRRVSVSVSGAPLLTPEPGPSAPQPNPQVDDRPVALKDGVFGYLVRESVTAIGPLTAGVAGAQPRAASLGSRADSAAVLGAAGVSFVRGGDAQPVLLDSRTGLIAPSLDDYGFVWSATRADPTSIRIIDSVGAAVDLGTGLPSDAEIVSMAVSRDNARIAILLATATGPRLVVKSVSRDANRAQRPIGLSESVVDANVQTGASIAVTWVDELSVATLTTVDRAGSVMVFTVGGERASLGQPDVSTALIGGNGEIELRALSERGTVLARSGNSWTDTRVAVSFLATQR